MTHADMTVGVNHILVGENAVGDDKVAQEIVEMAHFALFKFLILRASGCQPACRRKARANSGGSEGAKNAAVAQYP